MNLWMGKFPVNFKGKVSGDEFFCDEQLTELLTFEIGSFISEIYAVSFIL